MSHQSQLRPSLPFRKISQFFYQKFHANGRLWNNGLQIFSQVKTFTQSMLNFHNFQLIAGSDAFNPSLINFYEPSVPAFFMEKSTLAIERPLKLQESTSPGYILPENADIGPKRDAQDKVLHNKRNKKIKKTEFDRDYKPHQWYRSPKGPSAKQKQDRNLIPNTVHHMLAFVQKQFKSKYLTEHIFAKRNANPNYSLARFYNFHKMLRVKINNYVNEDSIRLVIQEGILDFSEYSKEEQSFYCYVSRVLIRKFLKTEAVMMILLSQKVKKENILDHLSMQRYLYEDLLAFDGSS